MAICDANYCFTIVDLGQYGSNNDSGVLANSRMGEMFENNLLRVPGVRKLRETSNHACHSFYLVMRFFR